MDSITISISDADKICKIIRDRLIELDEVYERTTGESTQRYNLLNNILKEALPENDEDYIKWKDEAKRAMEYSENKLSDLHKKKKDEYIFILEIMMAGSNL